MHQGDLFAGFDPRSRAMRDVLDKVNARFGRGTMGIAASALTSRKPVWAMNQKRLSPAYNSRWDQLLRVR